MKKKHWYDYLWIWSIIYFTLGFFNILFAWLGIKLFWTFKVPWGWTYTAGMVPDWVAQYSFGFYSLMLTSLLLGLIMMVLYKPRSWCTFCPMGTMTQGICKLGSRGETQDS